VDPRIEELLKESRQAGRIDRERAEVFAWLVKQPAWLAYLEILESKIQALADQVLAPARSIDGMVTLEYVKGAMSGLIMARDIPSITIAAKAELEPVKENDDEPE
jgi:hypothetical protein